MHEDKKKNKKKRTGAQNPLTAVVAYTYMYMCVYTRTPRVTEEQQHTEDYSGFDSIPGLVRRRPSNAECIVAEANFELIFYKSSFVAFFN